MNCFHVIYGRPFDFATVCNFCTMHANIRVRQVARVNCACTHVCENLCTLVSIRGCGGTRCREFCVVTSMYCSNAWIPQCLCICVSQVFSIVEQTWAEDPGHRPGFNDIVQLLTSVFAEWADELDDEADE